METTNKIIAANISYSGVTFNTPLLIEYKHTKEYYFLKTEKGKHILSGSESAKKNILKGEKVFHSSGYFFMNRFAIPNATIGNKKTWWYVNNEGDSYRINQVSKYAKKIHIELSKEIITQI